MHGKWPTKKVRWSGRRVRIHAYRGAFAGRYPGGTPQYEVAAARVDPHCWTHSASRRGRRGATGRGGGRIPGFAAERLLPEIPPRTNKGAAYRVGGRRPVGRNEATLGRARRSACCVTEPSCPGGEVLHCPLAPQMWTAGLRSAMGVRMDSWRSPHHAPPSWWLPRVPGSSPARWHARTGACGWWGKKARTHRSSLTTLAVLALERQ